MKRTIVIGDIHGCIEELDDLLKTVSFHSGDRLICVGDVIDRGPDPIGVIRRLQELKAESVLGNHEDKHLRFHAHEQLHLVNCNYRSPVHFSERRLEEHRLLSENEFKWMQALPLTLFIDDAKRWVVVHAGLEPLPLEKQRPNAMLHIRYVSRSDGKLLKLGELMTNESAAYWTDLWTGPESVVYGHHSAPQIHFHEGPGFRCIGLDTGCVFGRALSAALFIDGQFECTASVPSKRVYANRREQYEDR